MTHLFLWEWFEAFKKLPSFQSHISHEKNKLGKTLDFHLWSREPSANVSQGELSSLFSFLLAKRFTWLEVSNVTWYHCAWSLVHRSEFPDCSLALLHTKCTDAKLTSFGSDIKMYNLSWACNARWISSYCPECQSSQWKDKYYSISYSIKYIISQVMETDWLNKF